MKSGEVARAHHKTGLTKVTKQITKQLLTPVLRIRILDPGSGICHRFFPDPGSLTHILESFVTIFWVKSSVIFLKFATFFSSTLKK